MNIKTFLNENLERILKAYPDLFLVGQSHQENKGSYVFIIDGDDGFSIAQCGDISRKLLQSIEQYPEMDAEREKFSFSITSPGAEEPIALPRQYQKHIGRELQLELNDNTKFSARLKSVNQDEIEVTTLIKSKVKGRSDKEGEVRTIPFNQIKESKIILSFK
ncbi:MAG: hypothetical protein M0R38_05085 [Bacteroidia bacterium]|nr:hypothetical protein [Bacteroidia bacterium]